MKLLFKTFLFAFLFNGLFNAQNNEPYYDSEYLRINNIKMIFDNYGGLDYNTRSIRGGAYWDRLFEGYFYNQYYAGEEIVYDHGLWVLGKNKEQLTINYSWWGRTNYSPGPIINSIPALQDNSIGKNKLRVYVISYDSLSSLDLRDWPHEYGAPSDSGNRPLLHADQSAWTIYNSYDTTNSRQDFLGEPITPIKLEIQQLAYAYKGNLKSNLISDVVFLEYIIINKGKEKIDSAYIGFWTDIDTNSGDENPPSVDTLRQLGYCRDECGYSYLNKYPAVGYVLLYGPKIFSPGDTAVFKGRKLTDHRNMPLSSFFGITDNNYPLANTPYFINEVWNIARGFDLAGNTIIDPVSGKPTKFPFSGDPVTNTGWNWNSWTNGEAGFYMFTGPFTFEPADTQWVMYALTAGLGADKYASIIKLRSNVDRLRALNYSDLVKIKPLVYEESQETPIAPDYFNLSQNFPNPFNSSTKIRYEIPIQTHVNLSVYDILGRKVAEIVNKEQPAGYYEEEFNCDGLASGVYFVRMEAFTYSKTIKAVVLK